MNVLAKKGNVELVKYDNGYYAVEKVSKSVGMTLFMSDAKEDVINFFTTTIKKVRKGKSDFNLELFAS